MFPYRSSSVPIDIDTLLAKTPIVDLGAPGNTRSSIVKTILGKQPTPPRLTPIIDLAHMPNQALIDLSERIAPHKNKLMMPNDLKFTTLAEKEKAKRFQDVINIRRMKDEALRDIVLENLGIAKDAIETGEFAAKKMGASRTLRNVAKAAKVLTGIAKVTLERRWGRAEGKTKKTKKALTNTVKKTYRNHKTRKCKSKQCHKKSRRQQITKRH
jgi:hypothetical protein